MTQQAGSLGGHRTRIIGWGAALALLAVPLIAMQFTREVQWTASDFIVFGAMLGGAGLLLEFLVSRGGNSAYRAASTVAVLGAFLLVWVNLAVGVIGDEDNPANLMFLALLAGGGVGGAIARFRARGMARTMVAMALAQVGIAGVALAGGLGSEGPIWPRDIIGVTTIFSTLWLASAWLFHRAARD